MPFRVRKDARDDWFRHIHGYPQAPLGIDFDVYYLCLMAGLATKQKEDASPNETADLVDYFPGEYRRRGRLIVATFLSRELQAHGVSTTERAGLYATIHHLVDPLSPSHLSEEGMKQFNQYSHGGFEVLLEWFPDRPRAIETFLPVYFCNVSSAARETEMSGSHD